MLGCASPARACRSVAHRAAYWQLCRMFNQKRLCVLKHSILCFILPVITGLLGQHSFVPRLQPQKLSLVSQLFCSVFLSSFFLVSFLNLSSDQPKEIFVQLSTKHYSISSDLFKTTQGPALLRDLKYLMFSNRFMKSNPGYEMFQYSCTLLTNLPFFLCVVFFLL